MLNPMNEIITIETCCPICRKTSTIEVPVDGYVLWRFGAPIQDAFPNLSADVREQLVSGICPACWDEMFADDEEEDPEDYLDCDYEMGFDPYMGCYSDDCQVIRMDIRPPSKKIKTP